MQNQTWSRRGHDISLQVSPTSAVFYVEGPAVRDHFQTLQAAFDAIDQAAAEEARRDLHKLDVTLIDDAGNRYRVTGIHRGSRRLLASPEIPKEVTRLFPAQEWIIAHVAKTERLQKQTRDAVDLLRSVTVENEGRGYGKIDLSAYNHAIGRLAADIAKAEDAAAAHASAELAAEGYNV